MSTRIETVENIYRLIHVDDTVFIEPILPIRFWGRKGYRLGGRIHCFWNISMKKKVIHLIFLFVSQGACEKTS